MKVSKSAIFLFELMVIILVFTLASAVCTQIFARSYTMRQQSRALTMGAINAQTMAEQFKSTGEDQDDMYFDKDWNQTTAADAFYSVKLDDSGSSEDMKQAKVSVVDENNKETILSFEMKRFVG